MTTNKTADPQSGSKGSSYHSQKATVADLSVLEKLDLLPAIVGVCTLSSTFFHIHISNSPPWLGKNLPAPNKKAFRNSEYERTC